MGQGVKVRISVRVRVSGLGFVSVRFRVSVRVFGSGCQGYD